MALLDELRGLEEGFWQAAREPGYYRDHMRDDGLAVFAGSMMTKDEAARSTQADQAEGWDDVRVSDARLIQVTDDVAAIVYEGSATRGGSPYRATCSTVYARRGRDWQLVLHQQSAIDAPTEP